jgi:dTDP-4-dehydrorhamnose 3,5-epimerase-like enzyme
MINKIDTFSDNRADRFFDIFPVLDGQITVSVIRPNQFSGWHKHFLQTDYFCVVQGTLDVLTVDKAGNLRISTLDSLSPTVIEIPPDSIHSWLSKESSVTLVYYLTRKHDESDEFRLNTSEVLELLDNDSASLLRKKLSLASL